MIAWTTTTQIEIKQKEPGKWMSECDSKLRTFSLSSL